MKALLLPFLGLLVATLPAPAQKPDPESQAIVLAAAPRIIQAIEVAFTRGTERMLTPEYSPFYIDGVVIHSRDWGMRTAAEVKELAAALRAEVAAPADTVWCAKGRPRGPCHGTMKTLVRVGMPARAGDSAIVVLSGTTRPSLASPFQVQAYWSIALILKKKDGKWDTISYGQIGLTKISGIKPIGELKTRKSGND